MGFLAFFITIVLVTVLYPIALVVSLIKNFYHIQFKVGLSKLNDQFMGFAIALNESGNVMFDDLFNLILIKKTGYQFGNRKETILSVLGKNKLTKTTTWFGWIVVAILDLISKNLCENSIDNAVN